MNVLAEFPILDHFNRRFANLESPIKTQRSSPLIVAIVYCNLVIYFFKKKFLYSKSLIPNDMDSHDSRNNSIFVNE